MAGQKLSSQELVAKEVSLLLGQRQLQRFLAFSLTSNAL